MGEPSGYEDIVYGRADGPGGHVDLLARLHRPEGAGLGQGIVMVHGGAWTANDRTTPWVMCEALADRGMTVLSLDFRCGPDFQHPSASADIAAGVRYARIHADELNIDPARIGLIGSSSGGHLVLLTGMTPNAPHHTTTSVAVSAAGDTAFENSAIDAQVAYIVALWPVSDPPVRYRYAQDAGREELVAAHDGYFGSLEAMLDASVQRVLRAGEASHLPPVMVVQPGADANVPEPMTLDLLAAIQEQGGDLTYRYMPGLPHAFAYQESADTDRCAAHVWDFVSQYLDV